jgi:hypothetical protein
MSIVAFSLFRAQDKDVGGIIVHPKNVTPDIYQFALNSRDMDRPVVARTYAGH